MPVLEYSPPAGHILSMGGDFVFKRDISILITVVVVAMILTFAILSAETVETASWGLSFQTQGATPIGPASSQILAKYDAVYVGDTSQKVLYLTFDAGYENGCTAKILDVLKQQEVPAAFFLVGNYMQTNPDLVRRMAKEGHIVANHTMHHPDMSKISQLDAFQKELQDLEKLYFDITGEQMAKYYRPPQGNYSQENLIMAQSLGYKTVFWSLAYVDWNNDCQPTAEYAFSKLLPRTHNGAVVLLHSTSATNAEILEELITQWKQEGYSFGTLDALFG